MMMLTVVITVYYVYIYIVMAGMTFIKGCSVVALLTTFKKP